MNSPAPTAVETADAGGHPRGSTSGARRARRLLLAVVAAGVCIDLVLRSDPAGLAGFAAIACLAMVLVVSGEVTTWPARVVVLLAPVVGAFLVVRTSDWLVPIDLLAAAGLLGIGALLGRRDDLLDLPMGRLVVRAMEAAPGLVHAPFLVGDRLASALPVSSVQRRDRLRALGRGLGLAVPLLAVLGLLLASADAVFASFFRVPIDVGGWMGHAAGVVAGTWLACGLLWVAVSSTASEAAETGQASAGRRPLGGTETAVVLLGLVGVYGLFAASQVVAALAGESYIRETTGLTAAEYARSGFFQLLWAAGITLVVLLGLHRLTARDALGRVHLAALNGAAAALTLVVVAVAISRLGLYEDAFGLTMLRLFSTVFAWWLGVVFVLVGVYLVAPWRRVWWPAAIGATGLATLVAVNLMNPERVVAEHNLARALDGRPVDVDYLAELSDDVVPTLAATLDELPDDLRREVEQAICRVPLRSAANDGWYATNLSRRAAEDARDEICRA